MKIHDIKNLVNEKGEVILGADQTGSHACYLIYGTMKPKEKERLLKAGKGHEEIFLAIQGSFVVTRHATSHEPGVIRTLNDGQAFHLMGEDAYWIENATELPAVYVMAGGHSPHLDHEPH